MRTIVERASISRYSDIILIKKYILKNIFRVLAGNILSKNLHLKKCLS